MQTDHDVITLEDLTLAIANKFGIPEEDAMRDANFVLDIFGFDERVIDNVLEPADRQLIYALEEDSGIFGTTREETTLYDGREWRTHYWTIRPKSVAMLRDAQDALRKHRKSRPTEATVYENMTADMWSSRQV